MDDSFLLEPYVVAWNPDSAHLHLERLAIALKLNTESYFARRAPGWYILAIGATYAEAAKLLSQLETDHAR